MSSLKYLQFISVSYDHDRAVQDEAHERHCLEEAPLLGRLQGDPDQEADGRRRPDHHRKGQGRGLFCPHR